MDSQDLPVSYDHLMAIDPGRWALFRQSGELVLRPYQDRAPLARLVRLLAASQRLRRWGAVASRLPLCDLAEARRLVDNRLPLGEARAPASRRAGAGCPHDTLRQLQACARHHHERANRRAIEPVVQALYAQQPKAGRRQAIEAAMAQVRTIAHDFTHPMTPAAQRAAIEQWLRQEHWHAFKACLREVPSLRPTGADDRDSLRRTLVRAYGLWLPAAPAGLPDPATVRDFINGQLLKARVLILRDALGGAASDEELAQVAHSSRSEGAAYFPSDRSLVPAEFHAYVRLLLASHSRVSLTRDAAQVMRAQGQSVEAVEAALLALVPAVEAACREQIQDALRPGPRDDAALAQALRCKVKNMLAAGLPDSVLAASAA